MLTLLPPQDGEPVGTDLIGKVALCQSSLKSRSAQGYSWGGGHHNKVAILLYAVKIVVVTLYQACYITLSTWRFQ